MAIKKFIVNFTRQYEVEVDEEATEEYIIKLAQSEFNSDMEFGLIGVDSDCFSAKIIKEDDKRT